MAKRKQTKKITQINGKVEAKPSKTKSKPSAKKIEEQIHGKVEDEVSEAVEKSKTLDKILGIRQKNPFGATSKAEFEESLLGKNLTDLREIAVGAGIFPSGNPTVLKKKLIKGFEDFIKGKGDNSASSSVPVNNSFRPDSELQRKVDEIWSRK